MFSLDHLYHQWALESLSGTCNGREKHPFRGVGQPSGTCGAVGNKAAISRKPAGDCSPEHLPPPQSGLLRRPPPLRNGGSSGLKCPHPGPLRWPSLTSRDALAEQASWPGFSLPPGLPRPRAAGQSLGSKGFLWAPKPASSRSRERVQRPFLGPHPTSHPAFHSPRLPTARDSASQTWLQLESIGEL